MNYEYSGYLRSLLEAPSAQERDALEYVEFGPEDLRHWSVLDSETDKEWQSIPARAIPTKDGVLIRGEFEDLRRLDQLPENDPSFWVPLSSRRFRDQRLLADHHELVALAGEVEIDRPLLGRRRRSRRSALRHRGGNQTAGHVGGEGNGPADGRTHRRKTGAAQKAAAAGLGDAAESERIGALRIVAIKLLDRTFCHGRRPQMRILG